MIINSNQSEREAVINTAALMTSAARTAPKTKGVDRLGTLILLDNDVQKLSDKMREIGERENLSYFIRDSYVVNNAIAVVLVAINAVKSGLNEICQYCGAKDCEASFRENRVCSFASIDLGIALGSAISIAADNRVDNRIMFSAGKAALEQGYFHKKYNQIIAIALTSAGKNPFYDRTEQFGNFTVPEKTEETEN